MMIPEGLKKGQSYKIPGCENVFVFGGRFGANFKCFTRQDGMRFMGREFIEYREGKRYLNLELLK
jgi:hypothetical protein